MRHLTTHKADSFHTISTLSGSSLSPKGAIDFVPKSAIDSMDGSDLAFSVSGLCTQRYRTEMQ